MSKAVLEASSFFKKSLKTDNTFVEGFEASPFIQTPTIAIPVSAELTEKEKRDIQKIVVDDYVPGVIPENQVALDIQTLTNITMQIKSISAQSILLHGERIQQAQLLLANYREGAFSKWLTNVYGNRQSPYNMLRFYEFYKSAPAQTRPLIEAAPKKCMYLLASRKGELSKKLDLVKKHSSASQSDLVLLVQEAFPAEETQKKKKPWMESAINDMCKLCTKIEARSGYLMEDDKIDIKNLINRLQKLC